MRKLLIAVGAIAVGGLALLAAPLLAQATYPVTLVNPFFVQGGATAGAGTPFAVLVGIRPGLADTAYYCKPRLLSTRFYYWIDSTSDNSGARNTWAVDGGAWANCPVVRAHSTTDTAKIWTVMKCQTASAVKESLRLSVRLKLSTTNIYGDTDSLYVMNMARTGGNGGWLAGRIYQPGDGPPLENYVVLAFRQGVIVGSGISENNRITEGYYDIQGFFFIATKADSVDSISVYGRTNFLTPEPHETGIPAPWLVRPGETTWVGTPPSFPTIENVVQSPQYPYDTEIVTVTAKIYRTGGAVKTDSILWAVDTLAGWTPATHVAMNPSDSVYTFNIPAQDTGKTVYFRIVAYDSASGARMTAPSPAATYRIPYNHSIYQIQYTTGDTSPDARKYVRTAGIVTGVVNQPRICIGDAAGGPWHGLHLFRADTLIAMHVGDSVEVAGLIGEFYNQTEESLLYRTANYGGPHRCDTARLTLAAWKAARESYEGVLLRVDTVKFLESGAFAGNRTYHITNLAGTDTVAVYVNNNTEIVNRPIPAGYIALVANGGQHIAEYQLIPRVGSDIVPLPADVAVTEILAPVGTLAAGDTVSPRAVVENRSTINDAGGFNLTFKIGTIYSYDQSVAGLLPGETDTVTFGQWQAVAGTFPTSAFSALAGDPDRSNDTSRGSVYVGVVDVGVTGISAPAGMIETVEAVTPVAKVKNNGAFAATFKAWFAISSGPHPSPSPSDGEGWGEAQVYLESLDVAGLPIDSERTITFPEWPKPHAIGDYTARCSTYIVGDGQPANDILDGPFTVVGVRPETGWVAKMQVPPGGKGKKVKDGACLAYCQENDSDFVYLLKGNNTCEFYRYNAETNVWATRESVPKIGSSGKKKTVKKGATIAQCQREDKLYAAKGNNTLEFWQYDPALSGTSTYPWTQKADVPTGAKNVKEGTGAVAVQIGDTNYVYFLKGSSTQEFYRYNTLSNAWEPKATAPAGLSGKPFKNGSCLAVSADGKTVFALKASYNELFTYNVDSNVWTTRTALPLVGASGKKKKAKDGAGMAYADGLVYTLKGGNTQELWVCQADSDRWAQYPDIPLGGGKKVKGGGALVYAASANALYATKGNNTTEFYKYGLSVHSSQLTASSNAASNTEHRTPNTGLRIAPNPFSGTTTITYSLPSAGNIALKLYDVTGALVSTLRSGLSPAGSQTAHIDAAKFARGIYVLKLESESGTTTRKLVVE